MMQTTQDRTGTHLQVRWNPMLVLLKWHRCWWERLWKTWTYSHVGAARLVMAHPCLQNTAQVVLGERDQKVQALSPERAQESLTQGIAWGLRTGVLRTLSPRCCTCWSSSSEKRRSWSWMRKREAWSAGIAARWLGSHAEA
jgi:hypothetical protein